MGTSWQSKCGSMWQQSPAEVAAASHDFHAQFPNADCHLYLQLPPESMSLTSEMPQEHMISNMHGFGNLGHADLGATFLSLLSGPSVNVSSDLQHLLDAKTVHDSSLVSLNHRTPHGLSAGSRVPGLPSLWPQNTGYQNLISAEVFHPHISFNSPVNCSNSSAVLKAANLNFQKSYAVACQNIHEKDITSFSSLIGNDNVSSIFPNTWKLQKYVDVTALQKGPVESNVSAYHHGHNPSSSFPRVFCSGTSGNLFLSDTGLLGVVCACHGLYMSISRFSEHSGSCDVNPGNAVRMDNGETVAHWWKTFFSKSGIRVLEGHRGWDWPEEISATSGLTNRPMADMSNNTILLNQVFPFRTSVSYEQQQYSMINSKENRSCRDIVNEYPYYEKDRTSQGCSNPLSKCFVNSAHGNMHHAADQQIWGMLNSFGINTEKASHCATAKLGSIGGSENFPPLPNVQDLKMACNGFSVGRNTSFIVEGPGVSSNIELRLGQPPEQSQALEETKCLPAFGWNLNGMHAGPPKMFLPDKNQRKSNELEESKWSLQYADIACNLSERRGPTQLELSCHVGGAHSTITDYQKDSSNMETTDLNLLLLSCFKNPEMKWQSRNSYDNGSDNHVISERLNYESHASKSEEFCFPWSKVADTSVSNAQIHMNKGKEVEYAADGLLGSTKSNVEFFKTFKEGLSTSNVVLGESSSNLSPAFHEKSPNMYQTSAMIADESLGRNILNNCWKISCVSDVRHCNHDHVKPTTNSINSKETSIGCTSKNSVFVQSATPTMSKEKYSRIGSGLQDENMKRFALQNMLGLSNRDNDPASVRSSQEFEILKNPCAQSLFTIAPSISEDHIHLLDSSRMPKIPEVGEMSMSPGTICWMGHNSERFGNMTGRSLYTEDCDLPPVEQLFARPGGIDFNFTHTRKEQCSQGLLYAYGPEKCSSTVQANCLTGIYNLISDTYCNLVKEEDRSGPTTSLFHSKLDENCIFLKERAKSFEKNENLVAPNVQRVDSHSFQWRDVPKKTMESCSSTRKEQQAGSFGASLDNRSDNVAKCFTGFARNFDPLKEHEASNISSGCSAPDVTQSSIEVNKKDSFNIEREDIRCANNFVLDEGSGNDRSWSSDEALDNEYSAEFLGCASRINLIKREPLKVVPRKPSFSLIEEIRLQNSLRSKNAPYQIKRSSMVQEERDHLPKSKVGSKKRRKTVKWMKLDAPYPVSGQSSVYNKSSKCTEEVGQNAHSFSDMQMLVGCGQGSPSNCADSVEQSLKQWNSEFSAANPISLKRDLHGVYHREEQQTTKVHKHSRIDDSLEASEMFRKKRLRLDDTSAVSKETQKICSSSAELTTKLTLLGCPSYSLGKPNFYKSMARPIVSGKYGIISNGNPSKPTKIIPLRKILKTMASPAEKSNRNTYDNNKLKSTSVKVKKTSVRHVKETSLSKKVLKSQVKKGGNHVLLPIELELHDLNGKVEAASCSAANGSDDLSHSLQKCDNHGIADSKPGIQLKKKFKEGRKRSLHELLVKENRFKVVNSCIMKNSLSLCETTSGCWEEFMEDAVEGRIQTHDMNNAKRYDEKHQLENSDTFCCVCGSSDKDELDQSSECTSFFIKGLRNEVEAVDNENISFYGRRMFHATSHMFVPDADADADHNESLQPRETFLTCARTEGYKGRKREGFLHNNHQDANGNAGCLVPQEQLNAWLHIHRQKPQRRGYPLLLRPSVDSDCRKAYARYKQSKGWKNLVVYKSGIHALGLYTSQFISRGAMVVEYVGEIVGLRVADRRESEYHAGKKLQHKSACYFFRIDKEHIIDATRKGGIARFVNHSCQPNCVAKVISVRNEKKVVFFAERDIYPGEEVTYDYHFNHEDEGEKIPCYCNSKNCRRYLN